MLSGLRNAKRAAGPPHRQHYNTLYDTHRSGVRRACLSLSALSRLTRPSPRPCAALTLLRSHHTWTSASSLASPQGRVPCTRPDTTHRRVSFEPLAVRRLRGSRATPRTSPHTLQATQPHPGGTRHNNTHTRTHTCILPRPGRTPHEADGACGRAGKPFRRGDGDQILQASLISRRPARDDGTCNADRSA